MRAINTRLVGPLVALAFCLAASLCVLAYPIYVIRPFRYQGQVELAVALEILEIRIYLQAAFSAVALAAAFWCWKRFESLRARAIAMGAAFLVIGFAALSEVNVYELMFHPLARPVFASAPKTKLDGAEQVIAIKVGAAARAYPIRVISYHHIVNDVVAGIPVVATY